MEISIKRSPQHWCPSEGSKSELFAHENDALTALPQLQGFLCVLQSLHHLHTAIPYSAFKVLVFDVESPQIEYFNWRNFRERNFRESKNSQFFLDKLSRFDKWKKFRELNYREWRNWKDFANRGI